MRVLVTGAAGFVGHHLLSELAEAGHEPIAFDRAFPTPAASAAPQHTGDMCDGAPLQRLVDTTRPDACVHLAAISFVPEGDRQPASLFHVNVVGTALLLDALRARAPGTKVLVVSTAHVYGISDGGRPLPESTPLDPVSLYAISKACADRMTLAYARDYGLHTMVARPNNHTGPGQDARFVVPSFAGQIRAALASPSPSIRVGNLDSIRDFSDVRDVVRAYRLILERGRRGQAYNVSSQNFRPVRDVAEGLCRLAGTPVRLEPDPARMRPTDSSPRLDTTRIREETGWAPRISFDQTLRDIWETP